ncbi:MAG: DUF1592 domain-containing protein [Verrucomicrobiales bacterium]|nr:DUF1592 domain-containing protein [Verrucomicrobiales bacterium]
MHRILYVISRGLLVLFATGNLQAAEPESNPAADYEDGIRPLLREFCNNCHSTEKQKGDLDLERFATFEAVRHEPELWERTLEQLNDAEMPPKEKPQLNPVQKNRLLAWLSGTLEMLAKENAGDPGPVVLRRLSNAEYTWTLRDLTGVESLDPAREFPVDGAAGEGFTNVGAALVMSPALLTKYLDAAKEVAAHAVLLPSGMAFSPSTSSRDWTEEKLTSIRAFYARFSDSGGATAVNLQGINFETNAGGRLPLEKYLAATLTEREALRNGITTPDAAAAAHGLNAKYFSLLWAALNARTPSLVLDGIRRQWDSAKPEAAPQVAARIAAWQKALWRFTTVGHIGKRDGPKAWQVPVDPQAVRQEIRLKLPPPQPDGLVHLWLSAGDAADGNESDVVVWEQPRFVVPGRADLLLREVRSAAQALAARRHQIAASAAACLNAAAKTPENPDKNTVSALANQSGVDASVLGAWLDLLGLGGGEVKLGPYVTGKTARAANFDFISGWTGADALSVVANASGQTVRIPGEARAHGVVVHPSPKNRVAIGWKSPVAGTLRISAAVQDAHSDCGNGISWRLEMRRGSARQRLAEGNSEGTKRIDIGPFATVTVRQGDFAVLSIGPRDGSHVCDLTAVDLALSGDGRSWDLSGDVSPDILAGNPHADRLGNPNVWHFFSEPDEAGANADAAIPAGSLLASWRAADAAQKPQWAARIQTLLEGKTSAAAAAPDAELRRRLLSPRGPLLAALATVLDATRSISVPDAAGIGIDPALFGRHPNGSAVDAASLCLKAPALLEIAVPPELVEGGELVVTAALHPEAQPEASVQMQVLTVRPDGVPGLAASATASSVAKGTWSDGESPLSFAAPILTADNSSARRRIAAQFEEFRSLFPAALCYTKIVPVDEVVTLTLFYREDHELRRLMLDEAQTAELNRLWEELHFVSRDALTQVDAFEQLWQFATQDADPSAFEPMREPILRRAEEFRRQLTAAEPGQIQAVLDFAAQAWRRPLQPSEIESLRELFRKLREQELPHDQAVRLLLARVLVAPAFLYRGEKSAVGVDSAPVTSWELAARLSYFLWSTAPDAELRTLAAEDRLGDPDVLTNQMRRLLQDPRSRRLAMEFGCQWLHVRDLDTLDEKSERHFPTFNSLRGAMKEEVARFFTDLFQNDRSVLSLLEADHTFVNADLAAHYGMDGLKGPDWQRVEGVKARGRGGILGFAATLAKQSGASRTSPILRGNWLCESLLGDRLPPPAKGVPVLPETAPEGLTERQMIEKHSLDPKCSGCHERIDPFGFALEGYDAIGRLRTKDAAGLPVNVRATLLNGVTFDGLDGLRQYLLTSRREDFLRQFCKKLLGYALGRSVLLSDRPLLAEMMRRLAETDFRISTAMEMIVQSRQFREVRGTEWDAAE